MIIDCDSHFMPKDAFDYIDGPLASRGPVLRFDPHDPDVLIDVEFPGAPAAVPGTTPLPAPGSGSHYVGNTNIAARMDYYDRMGIDQHFILPQFTGWWSYLIEPDLATAMARSLNLAVPTRRSGWHDEIQGRRAAGGEQEPPEDDKELIRSQNARTLFRG